MCSSGFPAKLHRRPLPGVMETGSPAFGVEGHPAGARVAEPWRSCPSTRPEPRQGALRRFRIIASPARHHPASVSPLDNALSAAGSAALLAAALLRPSDALAAADQVWPAFVIVAGLILIGLVAQE